MNKNITKRISKIALFITLIIVSWLIFEVILRGGNVVRSEYGIDPTTFIGVLVGAEVFFDLGIVFIILGSGAVKIRLKHILNLDFSNIQFENKLVYFGFTINRIAAFIPPIYLLIKGWGKLPILLSSLILLEVSVIFLIATLPFELKSLVSIFKSKVIDE